MASRVSFSSPFFESSSFSSPFFTLPSFSSPFFILPFFALPSFSSPFFALASFSSPFFALPSFSSPFFALPTFSSPVFASFSSSFFDSSSPSSSEFIASRSGSEKVDQESRSLPSPSEFSRMSFSVWSCACAFCRDDMLLLGLDPSERSDGGGLVLLSGVWKICSIFCFLGGTKLTLSASFFSFFAVFSSFCSPVFSAASFLSFLSFLSFFMVFSSFNSSSFLFSLPPPFFSFCLVSSFFFFSFSFTFSFWSFCCLSSFFSPLFVFASFPAFSNLPFTFLVSFSCLSFFLSCKNFWSLSDGPGSVAAGFLKAEGLVGFTGDCADLLRWRVFGGTALPMALKFPSTLSLNSCKAQLYHTWVRYVFTLTKLIFYGK